MAARATNATRLVHTRKNIDLRADGEVRIVVVADTHSQAHPATKTHIEALKPDHILHAGDIGDLAVLDELSAIAPLTAIRGNIDSHAAALPDTMTLEIGDDQQIVLTLLLMHIAVYGPKLRADAARLAHAEHASLVVCGHSHVPFIGRDKGLSILNPGSIGPRRFSLPIVFAVMDINRKRIAAHHIDCETGARWEP
jgi:uncharacterized protein